MSNTTDPMTPSAKVGRSNPVGAFLRNWKQNFVYIAFVVIFVVFAVALQDRGFLTVNNQLNILRQVSIVAIMAIAMTFVLSSGEIDLSIGAVAGLTSVTAGLALAQFGLLPALIAGLATGLAVGTINGVLTAYVGIPSFLATLGMLGVARGTGMWVSGTSPVPVLNETYIYIFGSGSLGPVPILILWVLVLGFVGHVVYRQTPFGRKVLATGGNETSARFTGIKTRNIKFKVMILSSVAAAFAGVLYAGRLQSGRFQLGEGDELSVIAAVVLGGTSLFGGRGTVVGSLIGALLIGVINNGLILLGLDYSQQLIARGALIILAVAVGSGGLARR